jgi:hypothetical protein
MGTYARQTEELSGALLYQLHRGLIGNLPDIRAARIRENQDLSR